MNDRSSILGQLFFCRFAGYEWPTKLKLHLKHQIIPYAKVRIRHKRPPEKKCSSQKIVYLKHIIAV